MFKKFLLFALFIVLCFMMPCFFVDFSKINSDIDKKDLLEGENLSVTEGGTLKLLLTDSNEIIELQLEDYIKGVVLRRNANNF